MHAHQSKHILSADRQVERERERERERCVCSFLISPVFLFVFLLWELKVCVDLCKKSGRTRCLSVSILEYNINGNSKSAVFVF